MAALLAAPGCLDAGSTSGTDDDPEGPAELDAPTATDARASFVTWNLEMFPLTSRTSPIVASWIDAWQDDVIAVQEIVDVDAFYAMIEDAPGYQAVVNDDPDGYLRLGLVYNAGRVSLSDIETLFTNDDGYAFPRPPLKARVRIDLPESGTIDFTVVVVHLKSQIGDGTQARRKAAADSLHAWIAAHDEDDDVIVLGDFNEEVLAPADISPWGAFLSRPEEYRFLTYELNASHQYSQISFESFLDHILVTDDALDEYGAGETVVLDLPSAEPSYEDLVSDHLPVRALFEPDPDPTRD